VSQDISAYWVSATQSGADFLLLRQVNLGVWLFANPTKFQGELMKQNETLGRKELESINSEMFHSFDPDDASWIIGGRIKVTAKATVDSTGKVDGEADIEIDI
jgi:hypothetical protein